MHWKQRHEVCHLASICLNTSCFLTCASSKSPKRGWVIRASRVPKWPHFLWKYPEKEDGFFVGVPNFNRSTKHVFFYAISYFFLPKTQLRPLKMEVEEPFNIRVRLFVFPGAGDSVAGWIQFVNKVGNLRVVDFFEGKVSACSLYSPNPKKTNIEP